MKIGIVKSSLMENEKRIPIYPSHLTTISSEIRSKMVFEVGYGQDYGYSDDYFVANSYGVLNRSELFDKCDILLIPKPTLLDLKSMKRNQILCGWLHCVQQPEITQAAIDKELTLLAWESMNLWSKSKEKMMHLFYKNNELAGYAAILHSLELLGMDGHYGPRQHVAVIGYGSVSRGAIYALQGRGFNNIHVYTRRPSHLVADQNPDVYYHDLHIEKKQVFVKEEDCSLTKFSDVLSQVDIICNGVLQDTDNPIMFVYNDEISKLKQRSLIIDISCDKGMGFEFAEPTTFENPTFTIGDNITYYSVDHTPTYLWNAASREISKAIIQYLPIITNGIDAWNSSETIKCAVEIKDGIVKNNKILTFQNREISFPHNVK